jgi:hypothetical protein
MARRKNSGDDFKFDVVQGEEMTEADADALARMTARLIYNQILREQQAQKNNQENYSSQEIAK